MARHPIVCLPISPFNLYQIMERMFPGWKLLQTRNTIHLKKMNKCLQLFQMEKYAISKFLPLTLKYPHHFTNLFSVGRSESAAMAKSLLMMELARGVAHG